MIPCLETMEPDDLSTITHKLFFNGFSLILYFRHWSKIALRLASIIMFPMTLGLEEMLIGIVVDMFERFPSTNTNFVKNGFLNQSHSFRMVNLRSNLSNLSVVGINDDL